MNGSGRRFLGGALALGVLSCLVAPGTFAEEKAWVAYDGFDGPGKGKHIVLVSGDEEYRSEEALPQLGKILARHHGFRSTVLFGVDPGDGTINPNRRDNIPGLEALGGADLMVIFTRFRDLPDDQMEHIVRYVESGRPIVGLRTATHAFNIPAGKKYSRWSFDSKEWPGGFGRQVLGETWIAHHGHHGRESTRGIPAPGMERHPLLRGVDDIWGPTDVYRVGLPLPGDSEPVVLGQVLEGMRPADLPVAGEKNDPPLPVAWTRTYRAPSGRTARIFATTMGASQDLASEGLRRLLVNACYWCLHMEDRIPEKACVDLVGEYHPRPFGFGGFQPGVKPADHRLEDRAAGEAGRAEEVIARVEKLCLERRIPMVGRKKAERLAELVRAARPERVVECGTAIGYSALWIARELEVAGRGRLVTVEIDPGRAREAGEHFREAGLEEVIALKVGDARQVLGEIAEPVDFLFLDCGFENYLPCFQAIQGKLTPGAVVVADNAGIGAAAMAGYLEEVRSRFTSWTEWFDTALSWASRDAMEISVAVAGARPGDGPPPGFVPLFGGIDFTGWKVPEGDGGHWRIEGGVIDYDAESEAAGDKSLWTVREFGDFVLRVDWRIKETPYVNPRVPYVLPDGTHARDIHGRELYLALPDSDSGIFLRGSGKNQVNIWCWPIGSGELYGYRTDPGQPPEVRAGATPRTQADRPVGEWNRFEITMRGDRVTVVLNGKEVIGGARMPGIAPRGPIALQHHGGKREGQWVSPPSLLQFKNIYIRELREAEEPGKGGE